MSRNNNLIPTPVYGRCSRGDGGGEAPLEEGAEACPCQNYSPEEFGHEGVCRCSHPDYEHNLVGRMHSRFVSVEEIQPTLSGSKSGTPTGRISPPGRISPTGRTNPAGRISPAGRSNPSPNLSSMYVPAGEGGAVRSGPAFGSMTSTAFGEVPSLKTSHSG